MIAKLIRWSLDNRFLVLLLTGLLTAAGIYSLARTPLDAIPDLSDVQVIIKTNYPGQAPQVVEDQVTYPLATAMLSVPLRSTSAYSYTQPTPVASGPSAVLAARGRRGMTCERYSSTRERAQ